MSTASAAGISSYPVGRHWTPSRPRRRPESPATESSGAIQQEFADEALDAAADVVANSADRVDAFPCWVFEFPILVTLSGEDRAGIAAAHGDDHVGGMHGFGGEHLWGLS